MALSKQAIRAIAIRRSIARQQDAAPQSAPQQAKAFSKSLNASCVEAAGFAEHANYALKAA